MTQAPFIRQNGPDVFISVKVRPGARQTCIRKIHGESLCVDVHAPPEQGKANNELLRFFADLFGKPLFEISVHGGTFSRNKSIVIKNSSAFAIDMQISDVLRSSSP